jgi:catechol 2,3-dioxygenase-like lactoylglutathione lyase family enzyme
LAGTPVEVAMFDVKGLRTFAMSARDLDKAEQFYTAVLGGEVVRRVTPDKEQLAAGQVREVDVRLGNFEIHMFDASKGARAVDPHHTLNIPWQEREDALKALRQAGASIEKVREHRDGIGHSINVLDPDGNRWELSFNR